MKKGLLFAVAASMMLSASVSFAGFGVSVPGAGKPAASSSQAAVDVGALLERNQPILQYLTVAQAAVNMSIEKVLVAVGKQDKGLSESTKALGKVNNGSINKADSAVEKTLKGLDLSKANDQQKAELKSVMHSCKSYQQVAYAAIAAAALKSPDLLKDASAAIKSLTKDPGKLGKVKGIVATCQLAINKASKLDKQMSTLNGKLKGVREDLGTDKEKASKAEEEKAKQEVCAAIKVECPAL